MKLNNRWICDLTGKSAPALDADALEGTDDGDDLEDLPIGWSQIRLTTRRVNPAWTLISEYRDGLIVASLQEMAAGDEDTPAEDELQRRHLLAVTLVEGQLAPVLERTPRYLVEEEIVTLAPDGYDQAVEALGIETDD
jgi:hypothetical protein